MTNVTMIGTEGSTLYNVYVVCGNNYPGWPEVGSAELIESYSLETSVQPKDSINLDTAVALLLAGLWAAVL